jgi:hypothetical protein
VWQEPPRQREGEIELSATLELPGGERELLWYRVPEQSASALTEDADPFVAATALRLAKTGADVNVHGCVSPSLLRNLESYHGAWAAWRPELYSNVGIVADDEREREAPSGPAQAVCGFSGGVDSSFTAFRHARGVETRHPEPLRAGVMVHGFDIPLEEEAVFERAASKTRRQLDSLGLDLIQVRTNFHSLDVEWTHTFGPAVAGVLMIFGKRFARGLIAQGVPYVSYHHLVEGSNPLTDPLLSSDSFQVVADGAAYSRADKIRLIADWPEAMQDLRVCWRGEQKDRNCCECEKCIRNILTFRVLGLGLPPCFERDVADDQIRQLGPLKEIIISVGYAPIIERAEQAGRGDEPWVRALRTCIRRNRIRQGLDRARGVALTRRMKKRLLALGRWTPRASG